MIATLTMNPCIDITETIPRFVYGGLNRITSRRVDSSGKGINVAMVLRNLSAQVRAIGMNYRDNGEAFSKRLSDAGLFYDAVFADGAVRENIKLLDEEKSVTTEINQNGVPIREEDLRAIKEKIHDVLQDPALTSFVMTGSLPPGTPKTFYREVVEEGNAFGRRMILDAEGAFLLEGIKAKPYMIKPNLFEFETAFAPKDTEPETLIRTAREIIADGISLICISLGADGAMLIDEKEAYFAPPVPAPVRSTQGAGDSLLAGILLALEREFPRKEQLRWGLAAAQGSIEREGTLLCMPNEFEKYLPLVDVRRIGD